MDTLILATGYRPDLGHLTPLGALDENGDPHHRDGRSPVHSALTSVGLE
ncbi:hypothetical protein [Streptomyces sp. NPDC042319]